MCFVIGAIGAGVIGAFLFQVSSQTPTRVYQSGPSLSVIPDKINYLMGQPVHIRIIDSGTTMLVFSDSTFGLKIRGLDGTLIYSPPTSGGNATLGSHQEKVFVWNQTRTGGGKVFEGRYKIEVDTLPISGDNLKKSVTINVFQ